MRRFRQMMLIGLSVLCTWCSLPPVTQADASVPAAASGADDVYASRLSLFQRFETLYGIPWSYLAAIDQYDRSIHKRGRNRESKEQSSRLTAITVPASLWCGALNPDQQDTSLTSIRFFGGIGMDGDGDGKADRENDLDVLTTLTYYFAQYGHSREDWRIGLWSYYQRDRAVKTVDQFARIYEHFQRIDLDDHHFPIPKRYNYSYRSTWGDPRGWGGRRIHEGTDIFAGYGTPVLSTSYGVVEVIGWNRYGGWRIGMRDIGNVYHYFAHLSSFRKGLKPGDIIKPGEVIGYVGSSGYGRPGTAGKFPPHLHYGMYSDTGNNEWAFDPYPYLKRWEREMYRKKKR
ncbi:M23 family metallopeptidase [Brevibacillus composti]|uniref:M23 family metallopeptidase n=1 Tax=Brevibacillus composti TaxID=2796470 RepID=A0A7T5JPA3_9BACL|nr:M23 family metallopeptidase [Brevibacillus composti]QQE75268.1 M23 family metallopeptidase [Brevibacillus composti]QUO42295.1 M23 family metallopeptidase [Brevibacillus composti]